MPVITPGTDGPDVIVLPQRVAAPSNPYAPYGFPPTVLSDPQIAGYCYAAGFRQQALVTAIAVVLAESSGQTDAHNSYTDRGRTYDVWGLFQISTIHATAAGVVVNEQNATDPMLNAKMAYDLSGGGTNWQPWAGDGFSQFIAKAQAAAPQAAAAAGTLASIASTVTGDIAGIDTPTQYAFHQKTTQYSSAVPVWHVGEITLELITSDNKQLHMKGLKSIPVGGTGSTLQDLLVSAEVSLDNAQSTQVTLTFEQGDVIAAAGIGLPATNPLISRLVIRDLDLAVMSASLVADSAGRPMWQIVAISKAQMVLMDAYPPVVTNLLGAPTPATGPANPYQPQGYTIADPSSGASTTQDPTDPTQNLAGESADDYVNRMCEINGITFYGETSNATLMSANTTWAGQPGTADMAGYNPYGDVASGALPDSVWTYVQRLAGFFGFWFYESRGVIWFAQPSILVEWGNKLYVNYKPVGGGKLDGTEPIGTPRVSANIEEIPGGFARYNKREVVRQVEVDLPAWYGCQAKPGDELVLSGLGKPWDTNPHPPDNWRSVGYSDTGQWPKPGQKYIVTSVNFKIDGGLTPVTVKAEEVRDPNPQLPASIAGQSITDTVNGANTGAVTTSYVVPQTVETHLSASYRTSRLAADALKLAVAQVGIPYTWGGSTPQGGFDCSGLVFWACTQVGVDPTNQPRTSQQLWAAISGAHRQLTVAQTLLVPFGLLFPADPANAPSHVAISLGDGHSVLQAPHTGATVNISDISANAWLVQGGMLPTLIYLPPAPGYKSPDASAVFTGPLT